MRSVNNTDIFTTRYACNAPASSRHPLYKQRGILQSAHYKHSRNIAYIELTLLFNFIFFLVARHNTSKLGLLSLLRQLNFFQQVQVPKRRSRKGTNFPQEVQFFRSKVSILLQGGQGTGDN